MRNYLHLLFPLAESHGAIQRLTGNGEAVSGLEDVERRSMRVYDFFEL